MSRRRLGADASGLRDGYILDGKRSSRLAAARSVPLSRLASAGRWGAGPATDPAFLPLGSILAVDAVLPGRENGSAAFLGLAQDRGGAIKGSRLDLFCGAGQDAEFLAGHLQARSRVFLLLKK